MSVRCWIQIGSLRLRSQPAAGAQAAAKGSKADCQRRQSRAKTMGSPEVAGLQQGLEGALCWPSSQESLALALDLPASSLLVCIKAAAAVLQGCFPSQVLARTWCASICSHISVRHAGALGPQGAGHWHDLLGPQLCCCWPSSSPSHSRSYRRPGGDACLGRGASLPAGLPVSYRSPLCCRTCQPSVPPRNALLPCTIR